MAKIFMPDVYWTVFWVMAALAVIVFVALQRVTAGYGMMYTPRWGPTVGNRLGWCLMESPVFFTMGVIWILSPRCMSPVPMLMCILFLVHYFRRSFIFPFRLRGKSRMPVAIMLMGVIFNVINAYLIGGWLFYVSPGDYYPLSFLGSPQFIAGLAVFAFGMYVNVTSDGIIRNLRKPGDTAHHIPRGGMFRYVSSATYFGEITEWAGYAILIWSLPGLLFVVWTFANLAPRAVSIHRRYLSEFGREYADLKRKIIIPFLY